MLHFAVVGHHTRRPQAERLARELGANLFMDEVGYGATWNHLRALNWGATQTGHLIVLEDDAIPVPTFQAHVKRWVEQHPDELTSLYLGTGKPTRYQPMIRQQLEEVDRGERGWVSFDNLIHAVAYTIPCNRIPLLRVRLAEAADFGIGRAWMRTIGKPIRYTVPSLVEHADNGSLINEPTEERKAWRLAL